MRSAAARLPANDVDVDDLTASERAHRTAISIHCPNTDEMDMATRCDLAAMRDQASAAIARADPEAAQLLVAAASIAATWVYAPAPTSRLLRVRLAVRMMIETARSVQRALA